MDRGGKFGQGFGVCQGTGMPRQLGNGGSLSFCGDSEDLAGTFNLKNLAGVQTAVEISEQVFSKLGGFYNHAYTFSHKVYSHESKKARRGGSILFTGTGGCMQSASSFYISAAKRVTPDQADCPIGGHGLQRQRTTRSPMK
jgi:hypothetical protein